MDFSFTEDQFLFRDAVADLFKKECSPELVRSCWENQSGKLDQVWQQLTEQGVIGLTVPEAQGGLGLSTLDLVLLLEEAGKVAFPDQFAETTGIAVPILATSSNPEAKQWPEKIASGQARASVCIDSNLVTNADNADIFLIASDQRVFLATSEQIKLKKQESVDRSRNTAIIDWSPDKCHKLGDFELYQLASDLAALTASAQLVGLAQSQLDLTVEYVKTRKQFGLPIGSFQAIKHHLSSALVKLAFARPMVYRAAYSLSNKVKDASVHASMAKHYAGEAATLIAKTALQCHGAIGYTTEYDLHMWMKRTWALNQQFGSPAQHRRKIADKILD